MVIGGDGLRRRGSGVRGVLFRDERPSRARLRIDGLAECHRGLVDQIAGPLMGRQECFDGGPEFRPPCAHLLQERGTLLGRLG